MSQWVDSVVQSARSVVDQLKEYQPDPVPPAQRSWISLLLPVVRPIAITGLAQYPDTREVRLMIWAGCVSMLAYGLFFDVLPELVVWPTIFGTLGPGTIWAWSKDPPKYHPLPEAPRFAWLRDTTLFRSIDLVMNYRLIGIREPVTPNGRGHLQALYYHALPAFCSAIISDMLSYHFLKAVLSFPAGTGYYAVRDGLAEKYHVPALAVEAVYSLVLATETWLGLQGIWHTCALLGNLSGFWIDSEFPDITNRPWLATSLNDLWGRRYHQLLRETLKFWTTPIRSLIPALQHQAVWLISAILHAITYSAILHTFVFREFLIMFGLAGLGCTLEALFRRYTGRKVGGVLGWIWTWTWMLLLILPQMARMWWDPGAEGHFRERWLIQIRASVVPSIEGLLAGAR